MRVRTILLIVAAAAVVLFALLNWEEITRPSMLNIGWQTISAPLGLVLLCILAAVTLVFLIGSISAHTRFLMEARQHHRSLQAQRDLAERAEASRFTDLRTQLDSHLREARQRDTNAASEMEQTVSRIQRELRNQLDQMQRAMAMRMGEMEARLDARLDPTRPATAATYETERSRVARNPEYVRPEAAPPRVPRSEFGRESTQATEPTIPAEAAREEAAKDLEQARREEARREDVRREEARR